MKWLAYHKIISKWYCTCGCVLQHSHRSHLFLTWNLCRSWHKMQLVIHLNTTVWFLKWVQRLKDNLEIWLYLFVTNLLYLSGNIFPLHELQDDPAVVRTRFDLIWRIREFKNTRSWNMHVQCCCPLLMLSQQWSGNDAAGLTACSVCRNVRVFSLSALQIPLCSLKPWQQWCEKKCLINHRHKEKWNDMRSNVFCENAWISNWKRACI